MIFEQSELFPKVNELKIKRTKDLQPIGIKREIARRIEQDALHADKTANAVILMEKQRWVYEQYRLYTRSIQRAVGLIQDREARQAIEHRYVSGYLFKETVLFFRNGMSDSTVRRKLLEGTESLANTLKLMGFLEETKDF